MRYGRSDVGRTKVILIVSCVVGWSGIWYLSGFCRLRQCERAFRLDRSDAWRLHDETFAPRVAVTPPSQPVTARVHFAADALGWVRERQHYGVQHEEPPSEGGAIIIYRVNTLQELMSWLLSWGAAAEALDPPELRDAQREAAARQHHHRRSRAPLRHPRRSAWALSKR
jgi:predicted DNA-binding transcriptional regulator YafY